MMQAAAGGGVSSGTCRTACWRDSGTLTRRRKTAAGCWGVVGRGRRAWRAA